MRILITGRGYVGNENLDVGIFEFDQAKALKVFGHDVRFAATDLRSLRNRRKYGLFQREMESIPVYYVSFPVGAVKGALADRLLETADKRLYHEIVSDGWVPDIIHSHFGAGFAPVAAALNIPFVYTEHYSAMNADVLSAELEKRAKTRYRRASGVVVVSESLKRNLSEKLNVNAAVIRNIVDTKAFHNLTESHKDSETFHFVTCGNLIKRKGFDVLLSAFSKLVSRGVNTDLTVIGSGVERENLERLVHQLCITEKVHFTGRLSRTEISKVFCQSHAFVLSSRLETFGVVYIEAMASGLPVIATACGGPEEFITHEDGFVVPVDDVSALTEAMLTMVNDYSGFCPEYISKRTLDKYSPMAIAAQLNAYYQMIMGKK